jgi:hypothetical protein
MGISMPEITSVVRRWQAKTITIRIQATQIIARCAGAVALNLGMNLSPFNLVSCVLNPVSAP